MLHIIYPENSIWKLILLQTNIFNIFPVSIQQWSVLKILQANCVRENFVYLPQNFLWLNRRFADFINQYEKVCLTITTQVDSEPKLTNQINKTCDFKVNNDDQFYNIFISEGVAIKETNPHGIHFEIEKVKSRLKNSNETFDAKTELENHFHNGLGNVGVSKGR